MGASDRRLGYTSRVDSSLSPLIAQAARLLSESLHIVALVGAGISTESGIPAFRGPDGRWSSGHPGSNQYQSFLADPAEWWRERRAAQSRGGYSNWDDAKPNSGHLALADLETMGFVHHVVTQNIDNLHQLAGTCSISEFHGNRFKLRCIDCGGRWLRETFVHSSDSIPTCPDCGGVVKSDTVMFGEPIPRDAIQRSLAEAGRADCCLVIGTSAVVFPAANVPLIVRQNGGRLIEINPSPTPLSEICDVVLRAAAGEVLPAIVETLREVFPAGRPTPAPRDS